MIYIPSYANVFSIDIDEAQYKKSQISLIFIAYNNFYLPLSQNYSVSKKPRFLHVNI